MNLFRRILFPALALAFITSGANAEVVTLRLHQFLPPHATIPKMVIQPWAEKVEKDSGGRIKIQMFNSMQLGGKPTELLDQAKDGVVDLAWTALGYTPGRFPKIETFELPFLVSNAESGSKALQKFVEQYAMDEFKDVKLISVSVHGPGLIHSKRPITKLEDMRGLKVRGGTRVVNMMLKQLDAVPVGIPAPGIAEALSKGVMDATTLPWEVVPALKVDEMVHNHTSFANGKALYVGTFAMIMNKGAYEKLSADLKKVIDDNSGMSLATLFGQATDEGDKKGRAQAVKAGNKIHNLDVAETKRWERAANGVRADWYKQVDKQGLDGRVLVQQAKNLITEYSKE